MLSVFIPPKTVTPPSIIFCDATNPPKGLENCTRWPGKRLEINMEFSNDEIIAKAQEAIKIGEEIARLSTGEEVSALAAMLTATAEEIIRLTSFSALILQGLQNPD